MPRRLTPIVTSHFERNHLLAALPRSVLDRLLPQLESVELHLGQVLHEAQETQRTAVCNRHHSLDQQLCRWLLLSLDRLEGSDLVMTQELIANMLGVRREGVTEAATNLQSDGLMRYARGHIRVLDRAGLEKRTCECYAVVRREYERLLPKVKET